MMVMDEVWLVLCFGLKEGEEGFINAYTCPLPACTGDVGLSEGNRRFFCFVSTYYFQVRTTFYGVSSSGCWNFVSGCCHLGLIIGV